MSSRTKAKSVLIQYNKNAITFEVANKTLQDIFHDALKNSSIQGIMRVDDKGKVLVQIGKHNGVVDFQNIRNAHIGYFVDKDSKVLYFSVTMLIYNNEEYIGSDIVTFAANDIEMIINQNKVFSTMGIWLLDFKNNTLISNNSNAVPHHGDAENIYSILDTGYNLKTTVSQAKLHQFTDEKIQKIIYTILIILSISLVGIYFISRKLLGLIEIEIGHKKELQVVKAETAKFATVGYVLFAIEHEWRKPINYLSALGSKFQHRLHNSTRIDEKEFHDFLIAVDDTVGELSQTMTDFKQIYLPSYQKEEIFLGDLISQTVEYFKKNKNTQKLLKGARLL